MLETWNESALRSARRVVRGRVTREALIAFLGSKFSDGFSDSRDNDFRQLLGWPCGCRAEKAGFVQRLWSYEPCNAHEGVAPEEE